MVWMLMSIPILAQGTRPVRVNFDTKVIYTDSLTLPNSINVGALLRLLPELLQRPGDHTLSNYDVQVDGVSVGESADAVLAVVQLADIERLEVSTSPATSDLNEGLSGSINLCLRPIKTKRKGTSGKVAVGVSTERSAMSDLQLDYRGKKVSVRGMAFGENYAASATERISLPEKVETESHDNYRSQLARAMITYKPDDRNELKLTLTEGSIYDKYSYDDTTAIAQASTPELPTLTQRQRKAQIISRLNYGYRLSDAYRLKASVQYGYKPKHEWLRNEQDELLKDKQSADNTVKASANLTGSGKLSDDNGSWTYNVGAKASLATSNDQLMTLASMTMHYGAMRLKAGAEYQWNKKGKNDWTGRMVMEWMLNPGNRVRLLMNRQLSRQEMISQEIGADYLTDMMWGKHLLTMNAGVNYCKSTGKPDETSYRNLNLMALYQYEIFFLSVTANIYNHIQDIKDTDNDKYSSYCNLSVMPSLNMRNGWRTAINLRYYSKVQKRDEELGNCLSLQMNVGKTWGDWSVYAYGRTPLTGRTRNLDKATGIASEIWLVQTSAGCGASWTF